MSAAAARAQAPAATAAVPAEPETGTRDEVGMRISPEVVLLIGGTVLTVALLAVFIPFLARIWREDAAGRADAVRAARERSAAGRSGGDAP
jgi:hypothetical protein